MQKITPCLWFNNNIDEALQFYSSVFPGAKTGTIVRYGEAAPGMAGKVLTATIDIFGQTFTLLNGGPKFQFTEAISFVISCTTQEEVDDYWEKLSNGGQESMCGWLQDRFGLSWQVVPTALVQMMKDKDPEKVNRVMQAMFGMRKLELPVLEAAYHGNEAVA